MKTAKPQRLTTKQLVIELERKVEHLQTSVHMLSVDFSERVSPALFARVVKALSEKVSAGELSDILTGR